MLIFTWHSLEYKSKILKIFLNSQNLCQMWGIFKNVSLPVKTIQSVSSSGGGSSSSSSSSNNSINNNKAQTKFWISYLIAQASTAITSFSRCHPEKPAHAVWIPYKPHFHKWKISGLHFSFDFTKNTGTEPS